MKQLTSLVCLLLGTVLAQGTFAQHEPNALNGLYLYRSYCLICHGNDGKTIGPISRLLKFEPADLTSENYQAMTSEDLAVIIAGYDTKIPGSALIASGRMPRWGTVLSEDDLLDIGEYVSHLNDKDLRYRGDTRRGRITYKRACASCHGKNENDRRRSADQFHPVGQGTLHGTLRGDPERRGDRRRRGICSLVGTIGPGARSSSLGRIVSHFAPRSHRVIANVNVNAVRRPLLVQVH